jgi:homoserine O-acetyltransferase/O-succinyltransferase
VGRVEAGGTITFAPAGSAAIGNWMNVWVWGERYPDYMDALVPMASQPTAMASRNWMLRRLMLETIRNDPDYNNGNYVTQPRALKYAVKTFPPEA